MATTPVDRNAALEAKIDALTEQVALLAEDARERRAQREMVRELLGDLSPIAHQAMEVATTELDALTATADPAALVGLVTRLVEVAPRLERALVALDQVGQLVDDVAPLGHDAMASLTDRLAEAEAKGYFAFARSGMGIVDEVVTNFSQDDVDQLGANVVAILEIVKEITQPEILDLVARLIDALQRQPLRVRGPEEAPSLWALARQVRDPDVRRGMAGALDALRAVSAEATHPHVTTTPRVPIDPGKETNR